MTTLPPWLNSGPELFANSFRQGLAIGASIAGERNRAVEARARAQAQAQSEANQMAQQAEQDRRREWEAAERFALERNQQQGVADRAAMSLDALNANRLAEVGLAQDRIGETSRHNMALESIARDRATRDNTPQVWDRDPNKSYVTAGGAVVNPRAPSPTETVEVTLDNPGVRGVPGRPASTNWLTRAVTPAVAAVPETPPSKVRLRLPVGSPTISNLLSGASLPSSVAVPAPQEQTRVRVYNPATGKIE